MAHECGHMAIHSRKQNALLHTMKALTSNLLNLEQSNRIKWQNSLFQSRTRPLSDQWGKAIPEMSAGAGPKPETQALLHQ